MAVERKFYTKTISAQNTFGNWFQVDKGQNVAISIVGISSSTVHLQRRFNPTADARDVASYTADAELSYVAECGMEIRLGVKTSNYGSGDIIVDMMVG